MCFSQCSEFRTTPHFSEPDERDEHDGTSGRPVGEVLPSRSSRSSGSRKWERLRNLSAVTDLEIYFWDVLQPVLRIPQPPPLF